MVTIAPLIRSRFACHSGAVIRLMSGSSAILSCCVEATPEPPETPVRRTDQVCLVVRLHLLIEFIHRHVLEVGLVFSTFIHPLSPFPLSHFVLEVNMSV